MYLCRKFVRNGVEKQELAPAQVLDRHHYEATLPGFGWGDSMDWRSFVNTLKKNGFYDQLRNREMRPATI